MLTITIPEREYYDEKTGEFIQQKLQTLQLEHSLLSLSKWESKWKKPFLNDKPKSAEEMADYVRCMSITPLSDPDVVFRLDVESIQKVQEYIQDSHTATTIYDKRPKKGQKQQTITSELIYYWMIANGIPFECQKWHLGRLMTLIRICDVKGVSEQMSMNAIFAQNGRLNASRRAAMHSRG